MSASEGSPGGLSHLDPHGAARMVDVSGKEASLRAATARAILRMKPETLRAAIEGDLPKGDVFGAARLAGILAAKKTPDLVPLCHPVRIDAVDVEISPLPPDRVRIEASAKARDVTGVEMEALTAVAVAALTVYDMVKGLDRGAAVERIELVEKSGGKSGAWRRGDGGT